ncbi:hypothetical protein VIGAN_09113500, partial [Vigna angularis var. angularis]
GSGWLRSDSPRIGPGSGWEHSTPPRKPLWRTTRPRTSRSIPLLTRSFRPYAKAWLRCRNRGRPKSLRVRRRGHGPKWLLRQRRVILKRVRTTTPATSVARWKLPRLLLRRRARGLKVLRLGMDL